jgi:hypothetical protein
MGADAKDNAGAPRSLPVPFPAFIGILAFFQFAGVILFIPALALFTMRRMHPLDHVHVFSIKNIRVRI